MVAIRTVTLLDPSAEDLPQEMAIAPRLDSLQGTVVGLVDNTKRFAGAFLQELGQALVERQRVARVVYVRKYNSATPAPATLLDNLASECNAAIHGIAD